MELLPDMRIHLDKGEHEFLKFLAGVDIPNNPTVEQIRHCVEVVDEAPHTHNLVPLFRLYVRDFLTDAEALIDKQSQTSSNRCQ